MAKITRFEDIQSWKLARQLTNRVYEVSRRLPFRRNFSLSDQIGRASGSIMHNASGSIMHNIAQGVDAGSDADFVRFWRYALRSATEVQSQLYVCGKRSKLSTNQNRTKSMIWPNRHKTRSTGLSVTY
ncbi:MAG: four helix bundle protein [Caldilineaceae bacterium]|nr:four helix bundle protein [Caldilineaceae bacterium]